MKALLSWLLYARKKLFVVFDLNPVDWSIRSYSKEKGNRVGVKIIFICIYITTYTHDFKLFTDIDRLNHPDDLYKHLDKKANDRAAKGFFILLAVVIFAFVFYLIKLTSIIHALFQ